MTPTIEQDLEAILAELDDANEAEALKLLMDITAATDWQPKPDTTYKPFVYPH